MKVPGYIRQYVKNMNRLFPQLKLKEDFKYVNYDGNENNLINYIHLLTKKETNRLYKDLLKEERKRKLNNLGYEGRG